MVRTKSPKNPLILLRILLFAQNPRRLDALLHSFYPLLIFMVIFIAEELFFKLNLKIVFQLPYLRNNSITGITESGFGVGSSSVNAPLGLRSFSAS